MTFETAFPVWNKLNSSQKNRLLDTLITRKVEKERLFTVVQSIVPAFFLSNRDSFVLI